MRTAIHLSVATAILAGCALNARLLEDGKQHPAVFDVASGTMTVTIDGDVYTGTLSRGLTTGFISGNVGTQFVSGTTIIASDQFQALLTNKAGKILRCQFRSSLGRGQGVCQQNDGRTFDFVQ